MAKKPAQQHTGGDIERPPIVAVMGHIDHGKSTLLDYIRNTNVVESEAGGITQHLSAYRATHKTQAGEEKHITFLDTPGHESFQKMRSRGAAVADVVILIVSAEDGVKPQTLEAYKAITESKTPFIVAINKIDKPGADVEKTKNNLLEAGIYLEGLGGDIPYVAISAKSGEGIPELLDLLLLSAELEELKGDPSAPATGVVIESHLDTKKGTTATLLITNGTLKSGMCVVSGTAYSPVRIMENFLGKNIREASFSEPVRVIGFNEVPDVGTPFEAVASKKEAEKKAVEYKEAQKNTQTMETTPEDHAFVPIIIKADVLGSIDAIEHEIAKIDSERVHIRIVHKGVGDISENDIKLAGTSEHALVIGFNVSVDASATRLAEQLEITTFTANIIYELAEWLEKAIVERRPRITVEEVSGSAKLLKVFSQAKDKYVIGARIEEGSLSVGDTIRIMRRDAEVSRGSITNLQQAKQDMKTVTQDEFGAQIQSRMEVSPGDIIEGFHTVEK